MKQVLVYSDNGVDRFSLEQLVSSLKEEGIDAEKIDAYSLNSSQWEGKTSLLIFPGGRDIPYHQALKNSGTARIRKFVEKGGGYLGICAGAYFGCRSFIFEQGSPLEIATSRELDFFPGQAIGPAYGSHQFHYQSCRGSRLATLTLSHKKEVTRIFFNGGCLFKEPEAHSHIKILARYADIPDQPAAIVLSEIGNGKALLSGVHPEYCSSRMQTHDPYMQKLLPEMTLAETERRELFRYILSKLISC